MNEHEHSSGNEETMSMISYTVIIISIDDINIINSVEI